MSRARTREEVNQRLNVKSAREKKRDRHERPADFPGKDYRIAWIGVDQSYNRTGISVVADEDIVLMCKSIGFKAQKLDKRMARSRLRQSLDKIAKKTLDRCGEVGCVIERIRTYSSHGAQNRLTLSIPYIKAMGALNATISDVMEENGIRTYSVDTRAWKSRIVGTPLPEENDYGCPPNKWPTVKWACEMAGDDKIMRQLPKNTRRVKNTFTMDGVKYEWDDDAADSLAIATFGLRGYFELLKIED